MFTGAKATQPEDQPLSRIWIFRNQVIEGSKITKLHHGMMAQDLTNQIPEPHVPKRRAALGTIVEDAILANILVVEFLQRSNPIAQYILPVRLPRRQRGGKIMDQLF